MRYVNFNKGNILIKFLQNIRRTDCIAELMLPQPVPLCDDIKIEFYHNAKYSRNVLYKCYVFLLSNVYFYLAGKDVSVLVQYILH